MYEFYAPKRTFAKECHHLTQVSRAILLLANVLVIDGFTPGLAGESKFDRVNFAHHGGQLTVNLRLNETKAPAVYEPSAHERFS